jgi:hypothetical protein
MCDSLDLMQVQLELQLNPVADEYSALLAVVRPMLEALLGSARGSVVEQAGGREKLTLEMLTFLRQPHDGELGICFEYAVHDAIEHHNPMVTERIVDSLRLCKVNGAQPESILFGAEKAGSTKIIDTATNRLTSKSKLLYGKAGRPVLLKEYIDDIAEAFRKETAREKLPGSIRGIWKADLFVGDGKQDTWVGTSVKINPSHLEAADGLRIGVVPLGAGMSKDKPYKDTSKNLIICPIKHDAAFMQVFYMGWRIVSQVLAAKGKMPKEAAIPEPLHRQIAKELVDRMRYPVAEVVDALGAQAQPELLKSEPRDATVDEQGSGSAEVTSLVAPVAREV